MSNTKLRHVIITITVKSKSFMRMDYKGNKITTTEFWLLQAAASVDLVTLEQERIDKTNVVFYLSC